MVKIDIFCMFSNVIFKFTCKARKNTLGYSLLLLIDVSLSSFSEQHVFNNLLILYLKFLTSNYQLTKVSDTATYWKLIMC